MTPMSLDHQVPPGVTPRQTNKRPEKKHYLLLEIESDMECDIIKTEAWIMSAIFCHRFFLTVISDSIYFKWQEVAQTGPARGYLSLFFLLQYTAPKKITVKWVNRRTCMSSESEQTGVHILYLRLTRWTFCSTDELLRNLRKAMFWTNFQKSMPSPFGICFCEPFH